MRLSQNKLPKTITIDKEVGETPLAALEKARKNFTIAENVSMAYAGRLDPMASGKLLILVGDTCKDQKNYHSLEKEYEFEILLGTHSDSGDVLGLTEYKGSSQRVARKSVKNTLRDFTGKLSFPYPSFSSKTVHGKPLHVWSSEGRLDEIETPMNTFIIHRLSLISIHEKSTEEIFAYVRKKIETIPPVTEESKALGKDFRREEVRSSWSKWSEACSETSHTVLKLRCIAGSGAYMRTLAEEIGKTLSSGGLAYHIHRSKIGIYKKYGPFGFWHTQY